MTLGNVAAGLSIGEDGMIIGLSRDFPSALESPSRRVKGSCFVTCLEGLSEISDISSTRTTEGLRSRSGGTPTREVFEFINGSSEGSSTNGLSADMSLLVTWGVVSSFLSDGALGVARGRFTRGEGARGWGSESTIVIGLVRNESKRVRCFIDGLELEP